MEKEYKDSLAELMEYNEDWTKKGLLPFDIAMDIFDNYDADFLAYINSIMTRKIDYKERIDRAMPSISKYAIDLVKKHQNDPNYDHFFDKFVLMQGE